MPSHTEITDEKVILKLKVNLLVIEYLRKQGIVRPTLEQIRESLE